MHSSENQPKNNNIKVIFLDWNQTLSHSLFWGHLKDVNNKNNHIERPIINWLFHENRHIVNDWIRGKFSSEEVCEKISLDTGIDRNIIFDELVESCKSMTFYDPELITIIQNLRQSGLKVVVASDNMDTFRKYTIPTLKLDSIFDDFLISSEIGFGKEDSLNGRSLFFDNYMSEKGFSYNEAVLFDDSANKMEICRELGMDTILVKDPIEFMTDLKSYIQ